MHQREKKLNERNLKHVKTDMETRICFEYMWNKVGTNTIRESIKQSLGGSFPKLLGAVHLVSYADPGELWNGFYQMR